MGKRRGMRGMMGMGMGMKNASMSSPMMGLMKIREDNKPSLMKALSDALADGKLTKKERMKLKKQYPMAAESGKLNKKVMMALKKINDSPQPVMMAAQSMKPSLMEAIQNALSDGKLTMMELKKLEMMYPKAAESGKIEMKVMMALMKIDEAKAEKKDNNKGLMMAIKEALADGKLTMMELKKLKMTYPMAAESGKLEKKIMMVAKKEGLMGVLMDAKKSDGATMMRPARNEGVDILRSMEGSEADRKFAATNAFRKKVGLPPLTREKFEEKQAKEAEQKALIARLTMMENMQLKMAIKEALADGKLTMKEKMELKKEFPKAAESGQLDKKIMMAELSATKTGRGFRDKSDYIQATMMQNMELKMAIKDALADGKISMKEKMQLKREFPKAAKSGQLDKKIMMVQMKLEEKKAPATEILVGRKSTLQNLPTMMELKKAIKNALADGKLTMMEKKELKKQFPEAAKSGQLNKKIMMVQMMLDTIKMEARPAMMQNMELKMAIKKALADGKISMMEKKELKKEFPMAAESGQLDKKIMMIQMMLESIQMDSPMMMVESTQMVVPMMKNMELKKAIKDALADGKISMMEKKELKQQFPEAAESGKLNKKIMMVQMMLESIKMDTTPEAMMMNMELKMAIKDALADGKITMMEKKELQKEFPDAAESGKLDKKIMMVAMKLGIDSVTPTETPTQMQMNMELKMAIKDALEDGKLSMMELKALKMQFPDAADSGKLDKKIMMVAMKLGIDSSTPTTTPTTTPTETPTQMMMNMALKNAIKDALSDGKLTMMELKNLQMEFPDAAESGQLDNKIDKIADKKDIDLTPNLQDDIRDGKDASGGGIVYDGKIDSGIKKGDKGPHHGLPKVDYQKSIENYDPTNLDFVKEEGGKFVLKKPKLKRKDYSADDFRSEAFKSELDSRGLTGERRGGTVTTFKDQTGTFRRVPTDPSGVPKALTSDGKGGFKDLGSPPTLSTERDLFGDLDETRQSKLATIRSIVDNPQPPATQMATAMRTSKGLGILMDAGFTQTRTRMKPLLMTPPPNERETRAAIARIGTL